MAAPRAAQRVPGRWVPGPAVRLLLLAGTAEARQIARSLSGEPRVSLIASLAGATRKPEPLGVPTRIGGFGGRDAFRDWLMREGIGAVLDATHPFSVRISHRAAEVCFELGLPYLQLLRPAWLPGPGDRWTFLNCEEDAARHIPEGAAVFLATGRQTLERFAGLARGRTLICRQIDPPRERFPFPDGRWHVGRPPFRLAEEKALFRRSGVEWLVVKNSGGSASRPKLDAARELGLQVAMIRRPLQPEAPRTETISEALAWVRRKM